MRVTLDTNVLLSAFGVRNSRCALIVERCLESHQLVLCEHILGEFHKHLIDKFKIAPADAADIADFLRAESELVDPLPVPDGLIKDQDDLPVLGVMTAGRVDCLVTGDKELQTLNSYQSIPIFSPGQFEAFEKDRRP